MNELPCFHVNIGLSCLDCRKPILCKAFVIFAFHCLDVCYNPYNDFRRQQTWFSLYLWRPGGSSIKISSSKSLWRKALWTSIWWNDQSQRAITKIKVLTVTCLATGEKSVLIIQAYLLGKTLCDETCFLSFDRTICPIFDLVNLFTSNGFLVRWPKNKIPSVAKLKCT